MNTLIIAKMTKVTYDDWKIKFDEDAEVDNIGLFTSFKKCKRFLSPGILAAILFCFDGISIVVKVFSLFLING